MSIRVDIRHYREINKNSFKAVFSVILNCGEINEQKLNDCKYFIQGENRWFKFPEKEVQYQDGRKTDYFPYTFFTNKDYAEQVKAAVLEALKTAKPQERHEKPRYTANQNQANSLQAASPFDPAGEQPF